MRRVVWMATALNLQAEGGKKLGNTRAWESGIWLGEGGGVVGSQLASAAQPSRNFASTPRNSPGSTCPTRLRPLCVSCRLSMRHYDRLLHQFCVSRLDTTPWGHDTSQREAPVCRSRMAPRAATGQGHEDVQETSDEKHACP